MSRQAIKIYSIINEIYAKTIVTQTLKNESENPFELQIFLNNNIDYIFSSFTAKIGDSIEVKSKVIQKSKAQEKYSDSIASGNAAIFVSKDPTDSNMIINMGNIPPKEEVIFVSEFIHFIESSDLYEFELFRNLPIFYVENSIFQNSEIKGTIEIKTQNKINKVIKTILSKKLFIIEEKYLSENNKEYLIQYEYKNLPVITLDNIDSYIPCSKISFILEDKGPLCFYQKSPKGNELNYIIQYKYNSKELIQESDEINLAPSLFIFLLDQSGSMSGKSIQIASKALILFLQSLPPRSYYQIIGFGSHYEKYDESPKEYTQQNIKESIKLIETLKADKGGTDIYSPLKNIYESNSDYDKIKLPKNIFLLTDGEVENKKETLQIIEENNNQFFVYAIGIGSNFDEDLVKNAGVLGKGNFDFCSDVKYLNKIIVKEIKNSSYPFSYDFVLNSSLDEKNLYKLENNIHIIKQNHYVNNKYIIEGKKDEITKNEKIKLNIKYKKYNNEEELNENYEINPAEIPEGNELSKLIINEYLNKEKALNEEEKIKLVLKYQILTDYTSLFAEVKLSEKISEEMKKQIIGDEMTNIIYKNDIFQNECYEENESHSKNYNDMVCCDAYENISDSLIDEDYSEEENEIDKQRNDFDINIIKDKEINIEEIINEQNFVEGYWELNKITEKIKEKYEKEFNSLKGLKDKNITDSIAITILIIYFINKEYSELLNELILIIQKAKNFIKKYTNNSYENIIKEIGK